MSTRYKIKFYTYKCIICVLCVVCTHIVSSIVFVYIIVIFIFSYLKTNPTDRGPTSSANELLQNHTAKSKGSNKPRVPPFRPVYVYTLNIVYLYILIRICIYIIHCIVYILIYNHKILNDRNKMPENWCSAIGIKTKLKRELCYYTKVLLFYL